MVKNVNKTKENKAKQGHIVHTIRQNVNSFDMISYFS